MKFLYILFYLAQQVNLTIPNCFIYIKNLDKDAKITDIKSTNSKFEVAKRWELDAIEVSGDRNKYGVNLLGETSTISFKVIQNKKTYKLSCKIKVEKRSSPFSEFKIGAKNVAKYFDGDDFGSEYVTGKQKVYIKMAQGYVLDSISVSYFKNRIFNRATIKNGASVDFGIYDSVRVDYHTTLKPANYVPSSEWYGIVESPLHDYCILNISKG